MQDLGVEQINWVLEWSQGFEDIDFHGVTC
jgi:hypothetical protein